MWSAAQLSVERKKVEAVAVGPKILMSGGEIGHRPPASPPLGNMHAQGYASTVDIYDSSTGTMVAPPAQLSLARQYFGVASAGGKAFFGGGFANDPTGAATSMHPDAGFRSNLVDIYDSTTEKWSTAHLSTNRSNLAATSVLDRWVLFGGGTRIPAPQPDVCGSTERSAVVDIYDTKTEEWSVQCLKVIVSPWRERHFPPGRSTLYR